MEVQEALWACIVVAELRRKVDKKREGKGQVSKHSPTEKRRKEGREEGREREREREKERKKEGRKEGKGKREKGRKEGAGMGESEERSVHQLVDITHLVCVKVMWLRTNVGFDVSTWLAVMPDAWILPPWQGS